jgi:hypothetical protein
MANTLSIDYQALAELASAAPLPFTQDGNLVRDAAGNVIARCLGADHEDEANAQLFVAACNAANALTSHAPRDNPLVA